jgi:aryl-alcohol dehydrogenase-like predicted oxidoreductase
VEYVNLGRTGLKVSRICLGCMSFGVKGKGWHPWVLDEAGSRPLIQQALEAGINFFDTANSYSEGASEEITGRALRDFGRRDELVIATKVFIPWGRGPNQGGLSRKAIFQAIDDSGTDYVDLYQTHRFDPATPIEETLEALHDLVRAGKVRYLGASSMYAWQFAKALFTAEARGLTRFVSMQNHLNLLQREEEREMLPLCRDQGVAVIPWSPLARGRLTRDWDEKTERSETDAYGRHLYKATAENDRLIVETVAKVAAARGVPRAQVALAWLLQKPGITAPIVGVTREHHVSDAVAALSIALEPEEIAQLEAPYLPHPVSGY